jgi:hypothetical protein
MSGWDAAAAVVACVVAGLTITAVLDSSGRKDWTVATGLSVGGFGVAFFLFRFAGVL